MPDANDMELLQDYSRHGSETAFAELVRRHINLVYSVALRHVGITARAEEITQAVFIILARKAGGLRRDTILEGWLYETTRLTSLSFMRGERRRQFREQEAYMQSTLNEPDAGDAVWSQLAPLLDEAMARLGKKDRDAVILRFFNEKSVRDVATSLQVSETAAQRRIRRALEKMHLFFTKRGVSSTTAIIAGVITANSVQAAPVTLAKTVTTLALAKSAAVSTSTLTLVTGALKLMFWTKAKTAILGVVVVGAATYSVMQHQAQVRLRSQNESLQQEIAKLRATNERLSAQSHTPIPHLPAPQIQIAAAAATNALPSENIDPTNLYVRLYARLKDKDVKLTHEQAESFLKANGRSAANLLAAFRTSGDPALLKEAMEKYPNDPQVAFEAAFSKDLSPAEQRRWLDAFAKSAPDNALANYLSALNYFNAGQIDRGVQDLAAASGKPLDDYTISRAENDMEAYLAAGYPVADAEVLGTSQLLLPQLAQLKQLGLDSVALANAYRQAGDTTSAQTVLEMADKLGQQYANPSAGEPAISQLVGIAIERNALSAMDPNAPYGDNGQTVQDRLNRLVQQRAEAEQINQQVNNLLPSLSDQDWIIYKNRWLMFGEENAERWVVGKYGQP